ncbi:MAG: hypothetical protein AB1445_00215 [Bacillota bacterium]
MPRRGKCRRTLRPDRVDWLLTRVAVISVSLLVTVQLVLAQEDVRARLSFLDFIEGRPLALVEAVGPAAGGAVARLEPVLPGEGRGWVVLSSEAQPRLQVLVNARVVGDLGRGTLVVVVRPGDLLELDATACRQAVYVRVEAVSENVLSPQPGTTVSARAGSVTLLGRSTLGK